MDRICQRFLIKEKMKLRKISEFTLQAVRKLGNKTDKVKFMKSNLITAVIVLIVPMEEQDI